MDKRVFLITADGKLKRYRLRIITKPVTLPPLPLRYFQRVERQPDGTWLDVTAKPSDKEC